MITENTTIRQFLQSLGTECLRDNLSKNIWAAALMCDYIKSDDKLIRTTEDLLEEWEEGLFPNWIITDMRFPNEMQSIKANGGITIRVVRSSDKEIFLDLHPSETALDNHQFDYEIVNDGTIEDLIDKVEKMLNHFNLK